MCNVDTKQIPMKSISQLEGMTFHIPSQQRGYRWTTENVVELLEDLDDFLSPENDQHLYCLQPIAVVEEEGNTFMVLDGQQRLTTMFILIKYLTNRNFYSFLFDRDKNDNGTNRWKFISNIESCDSDLIESNIDYYFIHNTHLQIVNWFTSRKEKEERFKALVLANEFSDKYIEVIWYMVDANKGHEVFQNLNSGKISLNNTELIKSVLLNETSGLPEKMRDEAAVQFEFMERCMQEDRFWYMLKKEEPKKQQTRMDLIFNLVAKVSAKDYNIDCRKSFRIFAKYDQETLITKWKEVRHTFQRLYDIYNDVYTYHYLGAVTYGCATELRDILEEHRKVGKSEFKLYLRGLIRKKLRKVHRYLGDYSYSDGNTNLRFLFLIHNIETILERFMIMHSHETLQLQRQYEWFPFELLNKQHWDIEHISSQTNSKFDNNQDRADWLLSIEKDNPHFFDYAESDAKEELSETDRLKKEILELKEACVTLSMEENGKRTLTVKDTQKFTNLYNSVIRLNDLLEDDLVIKEDEKDKVWNLVLLDRHTNRSFHNSLFPRKRRIVLIADGIRSADDIENNVQQVYIPPCTRQCFTKAYSKGSNIKLGSWLEPDATSYLIDMSEKLCDKRDKEGNIIKEMYFDFLNEPKA